MRKGAAVVHELIDLFYASRWHDIDAFARAASEQLGFPITRAGVEALMAFLGVNDLEEALWRARGMAEEELRAILALPATEFSVVLRGREHPAVLISLFGKTLGSERYMSRKVLEVVRSNTAVLAISGEAPLIKGELDIEGGKMRVLPILGDSFHDPYIETILVAFDLQPEHLPAIGTYVRNNITHFLTFAHNKTISSLFRASRRADAAE